VNLDIFSYYLQTRLAFIEENVVLEFKKSLLYQAIGMFRCCFLLNFSVMHSQLIVFAGMWKSL